MIFSKCEATLLLPHPRPPCHLFWGCPTPGLYTSYKFNLGQILIKTALYIFEKEKGMSLKGASFTNAEF
jgi:hypothetical protein